MNFDALAQNFIGKQITIVSGNNRDLIGVKGLVVNETKNAFEIKTSTLGVKVILKNQIDFFVGDDKTVIIEGNKIKKRSEDRLKLKVKKWMKH